MPGNANSGRRPSGYTQLLKGKKPKPLPCGTLKFQSSTDAAVIFDELLERVERSGLVRSYDDMALSDAARTIAAYREKPTASLAGQVLAYYKNFGLTPAARGISDVKDEQHRDVGSVLDRMLNDE